MATTVGSHSVSTFATPVNGGPLDANVVRGNDNTIRSAYVAHDADTGIHVQSSTLANRPAAGTAGRKWITADTGIFKLWYDDGTTWHEVGTSTIDVYVLADENLVKGDIIKVTGYNVGNGAPRVAKVSSASDVAFGIVNGTIASGAVGYVTNTGLIIDLNTNSFAIGDILYPNTSGGLTTTKPTSGNYQPVAFVLRSNTNNGVLYVEFSAPRIVERSDNTASTVVLRDASGNFSAGTITAGALTSTGLVTFASLKGTGATTVTNIINDGTMATASATTLATSASIKTYVDTQIGANNDLSEVLANGNTTGANNIIVTNGQKITTNTIDETTAAAGVTIDSVLLKDNEVTATGVRVTNLKANDGTAAGSIANSTGVVTLGSSVLTTTDINGGTVDGTTIGASVPAAATFTNITSAGTINLTGATVSNGGSVTTIDINGGTIDGTTIGGASPAAGTFTTINATDINATTFDMTNLEVTNIKAKDGTASMTIADTTGNVTVSAALIANGNVTLGNATSDTITVGGSFPTGTKLRTDSSVGNTLAVSAYDVDGTAYVDLITATASNTPTLALTSTGVGSMNNIAIGGTTPAAGAFTTLDSSGDFAVATNKFTVASATGNTAVAGTLTTEGTLTSNGNTVLGNAATDTITATAQFVTGTQLKSAQSANNTLSLSAYDVDGTAYVDLVKLTAGNTPTLTLTSTGTGSMDNITIGGSTAAAGSFTSLSASGNFTLGADVVLSRGAANRLDLASGDSINVVSGDYQIGGTSVLSSNTLGSGVTASSLTSVGTLTSLSISGQISSTAGAVISGSGASTSARYVVLSTTGGDFYTGIESSAGGSLLSGSSAYARIFGTSAAYPLEFFTNNVKRATIDSSGNLNVDSGTLYVDAANNRVGVGTASPSKTLTVQGDATFALDIMANSSGIATSGFYNGLGISGYDAIGWYGANVLAIGGYRASQWNSIELYTAGTKQATLTSTGNLGLGVTPTYRMQVYSDNSTAYSSSDFDSARNLVLQNVNTTTNANIGLQFVIGGTSEAAITGIRTAAGETALAFGTRGSGARTEKMRLDASGNLSIGHTSTAIAALDVRKAVSDISAYFSANGADFKIVNATGLTTIGTSAANPVAFLTNNTERARITSGGYFKASDTGLYVGSTASYHEFRNSANAIGVVINPSNASFTSAALYINTNKAAGSDFQLITCAANDVEQVRVRGDGTIYAQNTTVQSISDARLKENVSDATEGLDVITALRPVRYDWKAGYGNDRTNQLGFIAQEVEAVFPEAVSEWSMDEPTGEVDKDGNPVTEKVDYKTVGPGALIPVLVKAIQELEARIAVLEAGA